MLSLPHLEQNSLIRVSGWAAIKPLRLCLLPPRNGLRRFFAASLASSLLE
jgi:hypothetical protein